MQNHKDLLASSHPIFRVSSVRVFWFDAVTRYTNQSKSQRYLAIASPGIFLFEKKKFPKSFTNCLFIPYSELVLICADENTIQFFKAKVTMNLSNPKQLEAVAIVLAIRKILFNENLRMPKIVIDPVLRAQIEDFDFNFQSESLLADRFVSLCLTLDEKLINVEQINEIYDFLKNIKSAIHISPELITSPLISALTQAIAYDSNIQTLNLKNINFPSFANYFIPIVLYNSSIKLLQFHSVSFNGNMQPFVDVWKGKTFFAANQIVFYNCTLTNIDFVTFMKSFKSYPADMKSLVFIHTTFNTLAIETIFSTVARSQCFRTLKELRFTQMKSDEAIQTCFIQFFSSDFLIEQKNLKTLSLVDACLDLDQIIPYLFHNSSYFSGLYLAGNSFLQGAKIKSFQNVQNFNMPRNKFTSDSLLGLFKSLAAAEKSPSRVNLDRIIMNEDDWKIFYDNINKDNIILPKLAIFSWSANKMNEQQMKNFIEFLKQQPQLTDLGVSGSILYENAENQIPYLIDLLQNKPIKCLDIRAVYMNNQTESGTKTQYTPGEHTNPTVLGEKMLPLLKFLVEMPSIKMLDVSGQEIGDEGLNIIQMFSTKEMDDIRFDGSFPSSPEIFSDTITKIIQSSTLSSEWPENDLKFVIGKVSPPNRPQYIRQLTKLREKFFNRFIQDECLSQNNSNQPLNRTRHNGILSRRISHAEPSNDLQIPLTVVNLLTYREEFIQNAFLECFGEDIDISKTDPVLQAFEQMNEESSITLFIQNNKNI